MDSLVDAPEFGLNVYGVTVLVRAQSARHLKVITMLREDFGYFLAEATLECPRLRFELYEQEPSPDVLSKKRKLRKLFSTRMCHVFGWGPNRICDYGEGLLIDSENEAQSRYFRIYDPLFLQGGDSVYEITYTTLLSAIGEELDKAGFHRVHALGFERQGEGWLAVRPSGGGKSSLASALLRDPQVRLMSDEQPLVRGCMLYPFPIRIALAPEIASELMHGIEGRPFRRRLFKTKMLFPIPHERVAKPVPLRNIEVDKAGPFPLIASLVVGLGLAQMAEHMLRLESAHRLIGIAFSRLVTAIRIRLTTKRRKVA